MGPHTILTSAPVVFVVFVLVLWGSAWVGVLIRARSLEETLGKDFELILGATLTLLALIIGFSFSMATNRYDERKGLEEAEAVAIRTEYVRAQLLPAADTASVRALLKTYVDERISYYTTRGPQRQQIDLDTAQLQTELWSAVRLAGGEGQTAVRAVVLSGMNDVLNSQGHTQAAWWNRIPTAAWSLMIIVAVGANILVGYALHRGKGRLSFLLILPVLVSIAFLLIAELDSPRGGLIPVSPENLLNLASSLHGQ